MSNVEVKAIVASITSAFSSSIDVFHRVHNSRRDKQRKDIASDGELRLTKSLHKAHRAISREYARDYDQLGQQFATGDVIAQTVLADTLLKLNIGLVNIISAFLAGNPNNVQLDLRSLTELSDTSRKEALDALGHLYSRLTKPSTTVQQQVTGHAKPSSQDRGPKSDTSRPSKNKPKAKENSTMPITGGVLPSLVNSVACASVPVPSQRPRGAWVRSRRSSASSSVTYISAEPKWNPAPSRAVAIASTSTQKIPILPATESVPPDQTPPTQFTPKKAPPVPSKPLALQSPTPMCLIKASTSVYSFASDSTKLGEIPQHKWATPACFHGLETKNLSVTAAPPDAYTGAEGTKDKAKGKAKFLNFFRRGTASNAEVQPV
ncbi:MAG: hypothetical protein M1836_000369 [Candelina mexicana]|nr:MAG: hypothetical protein M1836_000369 [Candelina mexicana]